MAKYHGKGRRMRQKSRAKEQFEDISSYSLTNAYKKKKNRRGRTVLKSIAAFFCVLLVAAGAGIIFLSEDLLANLSTVPITKDKEELGISPTATTDENITNIALFGVDSRDGSFTGLSDTIMILTVDNKHNKLKLTSILRDSKVYIDGYGWEKINAAFSIGGYELAIRTINQNFNMNIEDCVIINFYNLAKIVDAFGGVTITMSDEEAYQTNENINSLMYDEIRKGYERTIYESDFLPVDEDGYVHGGTFLLNGNQAVGYARNRSDNDDNRAQRQQNVLTALLSEVTSISSNRYYGMLQEIFPLCQTTLYFDDVWKLAPILLKDFQVETRNIPSADENAININRGDGLGEVYEYDLSLAAEHLDLFINEEGSPYWEKDSSADADNQQYGNYS